MTDPANMLWVFMHGEPIGVAARGRRGAVYFSYLPDHIEGSTPLSLSLRPDRSGMAEISDWLDGLLPDNPRTRSRWAREFDAPSNDPFDLLGTEAGLECAGAVQFIPGPELPELRSSELGPLSESGVAQALREVMQDADDASYEAPGRLWVSLPGAQPKLALRLIDGGWCLPTGALATTHILKPQRGHLNEWLRDSIAVNEHLCQTAASGIGLNAAHTSLSVFEDEVCLVSERFDRRGDGNHVHRLHFEDLCQALGFAPSRKYQAEGGPDPKTILQFLREEGGRASQREFFLAVFYNHLIGNSDGHAKNHGMILDGSLPRLAPAYDLSSTAIYPELGEQAKIPAMRFSGPQPTTLHQWAQIASRHGVNVSVDELHDMTESLPRALESAAEQCPEWAAGAAERMCEFLVAQVRSTAPSRGDGFRTPQSRAPKSEDAGTESEDDEGADEGTACGVIVESTGNPCLLRSEHGGNHRSVLRKQGDQ